MVKGTQKRWTPDSCKFWHDLPRKMAPGVCKSIAHNLKVIKIMDRIDEDRHNSCWSEAATTV